MRRRAAPRSLGPALDRLAEDVAPPTAIARVQRAWPQAAGEAIAREATPVSERGGVVTVSCSSSVWAHELDLLGPSIITRLEAVLGAGSVRRLRCVATPVRRPT